MMLSLSILLMMRLNRDGFLPRDSYSLLVWLWYAPGVFSEFLCLIAFKADLGSSMPTSGGLYYWTFYFASVKTRRALSFLVGYSNTLGLVGGLCSIDCEYSSMYLLLNVIDRQN